MWFCLIQSRKSNPIIFFSSHRQMRQAGSSNDFVLFCFSRHERSYWNSRVVDPKSPLRSINWFDQFKSPIQWVTLTQLSNSLLTVCFFFGFFLEFQFFFVLFCAFSPLEAFFFKNSCSRRRHCMTFPPNFTAATRWGGGACGGGRPAVKSEWCDAAPGGWNADLIRFRRICGKK